MIFDEAEALNFELDRLRERLGSLSLVSLAYLKGSEGDCRIDISQPPGALSDVDIRRTLEIAHRSAETLEPDALELTSGLGAFSVGLVSWNRKVRIGLVAVNPSVLPDDLVAADEIGGLIPWAVLAVNPNAPMREFYDEVAAAPAPRAFLASVVDKMGLDAAILWIKEPDRLHNGSRSHQMVAIESIGVVAAIDDFTVPANRGIVGRFSVDTNVAIYNLDDSAPYNGLFVRSEGWREMIGAPVVAGGQLIGSLTAYARSPFLKQADIDQFEGFILESVPHVRRHRKNYLAAQRDREIREGLERLQIGVEILGFAHDLANSAAKASSRAQELGSIVPSNSTNSAMKAVVTQLKSESNIVHRVTRAMNRLAEGRRRELIDFDLAVQLDEIDSIIAAISDDVKVHVHRGFVVRGDPLDVQRIVLNLVSNAKHWTSDDHARIEVTANRINTSAGEMVDLKVKDNGRGMTIAEAKLAPTMLYSTRAGGLGLGLFVAKGLAERLGGTLRISSKRHFGTAVTVRLPLVDPTRRRGVQRR